MHGSILVNEDFIKGNKASYFHVYTATISFAKLHFLLLFFPDQFIKSKPNRRQMQYKSNKGKLKKINKILCSLRSTSVNLLALFSFLLSLFFFCIPSQISSSLKQSLIKLPKGPRLHAAISPLLSAQMFQAHSITPTCHYS